MILHVAGWVHVVGGRLLAVRARGRSSLYLPGGKVEPGESPLAAVRREVLEELGVSLVDVRPLGVVTAPGHDQPPGTVISMSCFTGSPTGPFVPGAEVSSYCWVSAGECSLLAPASLAALRLYDVAADEQHGLGDHPGEGGDGEQGVKQRRIPPYGRQRP